MDTEIGQEPLMMLPLSRIDTEFARYRLMIPGAEKAMTRSMEQYGQISPVIVGRPVESHYPLVDGFKRLRAAHKLGCATLKASVLGVGLRALKVAMIQLNRKARSIAGLEEAMIVHSLHREDHLSQVEIAVMVGRHKSWVCRRIAMIERLNEEVLEQIRLGLVNVTIGRALTQLPQGNQVKALGTIQKHRMCCRESAKLVALLQEAPRWEHERILRHPAGILSERQPDRPSRNEPPSASLILCKELSRIGKRCETLSAGLQEVSPLFITPEERRHALTLIEGIEGRLNTLKSLPHLTEGDNEPLF